MAPQLGDTVLYTPKALDGIPNDAQEQRPAIVTKVHFDGTYDLQIFWRDQVKPLHRIPLLATPNGTVSPR